MDEFRIDQELFRSIPADLMLRYGFVPYRREGKALVIVVSDPTRPADDRRARRRPRHADQGHRRRAVGHPVDPEEERELTAGAGGGDRRLPAARSLKEDETGDENLTVERLTSDTSPIIRLVDSTIYTAIQRRASDIHIETGDDAVHVKYRIDGVLQPAMRPIAKEFHSSDHFAHQGDGGARHRREARPAGRPLQGADAAARRSTSASRSCRACTARTP